MTDIVVDKENYERNMRDLRDYREWNFGNFTRQLCGRLAPDGYVCGCHKDHSQDRGDIYEMTDKMVKENPKITESEIAKQVTEEFLKINPTYKNRDGILSSVYAELGRIARRNGIA